MLPDGIDSGWFWIHLATTLAMPPASPLLLMLLGVLLTLRRRPNMGWFCLLLGAMSLWILSTPWVGQRLQASLTKDAPFDAQAYKTWKLEDRPQAIVVLGGGANRQARERTDGEDVSMTTLNRLRYAASLQRITKLPLVTTGGKPTGGQWAEGVLMARVLEKEFNLPVLLVESQSLNTEQNARLTQPLLEAAGFKRIVLVTDASHMRRARVEFRQAGLWVVPAPMGFRGVDAVDPKTYLPSADGLALSRDALREWLGILTQTLRLTVRGKPALDNTSS